MYPQKAMDDSTANSQQNSSPQQQSTSVTAIGVNPIENSRLNDGRLSTVSPPSYCRVSIPVALEHPSILPNSTNQEGLPSYNEAINPNGKYNKSTVIVI